MDKNRLYYVDNLSALLIAYMIFVVHLTYFCSIKGPIFDVLNVLLFFFMSWFFFKSGMFYKEKPVKVILSSSLHRLMVPYIVFNFAGIIVLALEKIQEHSTFALTSFVKEVLISICINESVFPNLALWFLLSLFVVRNVFNILRKLKVNTFVTLAVSLACLFTIYYLCYYSEFSINL